MPTCPPALVALSPDPYPPPPGADGAPLRPASPRSLLAGAPASGPLHAQGPAKLGPSGGIPRRPGRLEFPPRSAIPPTPPDRKNIRRSGRLGSRRHALALAT